MKYVFIQFAPESKCMMPVGSSDLSFHGLFCLDGWLTWLYESSLNNDFFHFGLNNQQICFWHYYDISADLFKNIRKIKILYLVKEFPKKDCDDEDDCGSAADVFNNDGSGDGMVKDKVIHVQIVTDLNICMWMFQHNFMPHLFVHV